MRKAIVERSTGLVTNVIEISPDNSGGYDHWQPPEGCDMIDADVVVAGDEVRCGPNWTWDGTTFLHPPYPVQPRLDILWRSPLWNIVNGERVYKDDQVLADERAELLELLHHKIQHTPEDFTLEEIQRMLQLERQF